MEKLVSTVACRKPMDNYFALTVDKVLCAIITIICRTTESYWLIVFIKQIKVGSRYRGNPGAITLFSRLLICRGLLSTALIVHPLHNHNLGSMIRTSAMVGCSEPVTQVHKQVGHAIAKKNRDRSIMRPRLSLQRKRKSNKSRYRITRNWDGICRLY